MNDEEKYFLNYRYDELFLNILLRNPTCSCKLMKFQIKYCVSNPRMLRAS